jgi:hypothetical protein
MYEQFSQGNIIFDKNLYDQFFIKILLKFQSAYLYTPSHQHIDTLSGKIKHLYLFFEILWARSGNGRQLGSFLALLGYWNAIAQQLARGKGKG